MNNNQNFEALDLITLIGFIAQVQNMQQDSKEKDYIHNVIFAIANEIDRLHKQNDRIEHKIDKVLQILKEVDEV